MRLKVTAKQGYSNPRRGLELQVGNIIDVDDVLALKLLKHRICEPAPAVVETAVRTAPQHKAKRVSKPAKGGEV